MTSTGIVRRIDGLGRIVLPKELRATLDLNDRDPLEIYTEGNTIILKKYEPACLYFLQQHKGSYQLPGPQHLQGLY